MIVIIGLVILFVAVLIGVVGVFANGGSNHALTDHFSDLGYHVTGSTGVLFLYGIVVGGIGIAGLGVLLAGAGRTARRGRNARRELVASRQDPAGPVARVPESPQSLGVPQGISANAGAAAVAPDRLLDRATSNAAHAIDKLGDAFKS